MMCSSSNHSYGLWQRLPHGDESSTLESVTIWCVTVMSTEMDSMLQNHMWDFVPQPQGKNVMKFQWVYKTKFTFQSVIECHKAHLFMKGFS